MAAKKKDWRSANIYIGIIAFLVIIIYISGYTWHYLNRPKISIEVVEMGAIQFPRTQQGLIVRSETTVKAENDGTVNFAYNENERVKSGSVVCDVRDEENSNLLAEKILGYDEQIYELQKTRMGIDLSKYSDEVKRIQLDIQDIVDMYVSTFINSNAKDILSFNYALQNSINQRNKVLMSEENKATKQFTDSKQVYQTQLNSKTRNYYAPQSGVLSFALDGYENALTPDKIMDLKKEEIQNYGAGNYAAVKSSVSKGDGLYKIITSNMWYIVSYIDSETASYLKEGKSQKLYIGAGNSEKQVDMVVNYIQEQGEDYLVVFQSNNQMIDFIKYRTISFEIRDNIYSGLKIPNKAITERTMLIVPHNYVTEQNKQTGLVVNKDGTPTFVPVKISSNAGEYDYIEQNAGVISVGNVIISMETELPDYTISSVETIKGVFVANSGIAEFKAIKVLDSNMNYSVVKDDIKYSVKLYDRIVSDVSTISNQQMIY